MATTSFKKREGKKDASSSEKRPKRFKVGRACENCRKKKIKCNGIQPCMQCAARQLSCTFFVDGSTENDGLTLSEQSDTDTSSTPMLSTNGDYQHLDGNQVTNQTAAQSRPLSLENTINMLDSLGGTTWLDKGNKGNWYIDEHQLLEEHTIKDPLSLLALPISIAAAAATHKTTMPPRKIQRQLIQTYYRHKYPLFHMVPQGLLLQHFDNPSTSISPMLLLAMFAHGAQFDSAAGGTKADGYFDQAKDLLNSVLGVPCLSTVVALCILSLYEPKLGADYRSQSVSYSTLAFRMCDELGYGQQASRSSCVDGDGGEKELHKRVAWGCYCLDKMQGTYLGHPWIIRLQDMNVDLPRCYWANEDQEQMECFVAFIKLMQMAEQSLKPYHFMKYPTGGHLDEPLAHRLDEDLFHWLQALPLHLHWTPLHTSNLFSSSSTSTSPSAAMPMPSHPPRNAWIAHLHLLFNLVQLRILLPFASPSCSNKLLHQRCMSVATQLIQLTWYMAKQPDYILSYALTGTAIMAATRSHFMNCGHQVSALAWHARYMFQRGIQSLSILMQHEQRSIPGIDPFLARVEEALRRMDTKTSTATTNGQLLTPPNGNMDDTNHMHLTGSEQNAAEVLSHAFGAPSSSTSTPPSTSIWQPTMDNHHEHSYHPHQHLHEVPHHHLTTSTDPLDFLGTAASTEAGTVMDDTWNERMAPSSVDALLYKSQQEIASGGLLMSHAKLNDPFLLSSWMMRHSKDLMATPPPPPPPSNTSISTHQPIPPPMTTVADESLFWPQLPLETPPPTSTPTTTSSPSASSALKRTPTTAAIGMPGRFPYGQYMNIGLGVYASAHQHHNDVIRQHIPDTPGRKTSRPVILTHQGQVIVTPSDNTSSTPNDTNANDGGAIMG